MAGVATASAGRGGPPRPWTQVWIDSLPVGPVWAGLALAVGHVLLGALFYAVFVTADPRGWWTAYREALGGTLVFAVLVGYGPAALALARRSHRRCLAELRPALRCSGEEFEAISHRIAAFHPGWLRTIGVATIVLTFTVNLFTTSAGRRYDFGHPVLTWILWQNCLAFFLNARTIAHDLRVGWLLSRASGRFARIDLLDPQPLEPLARRGLGAALLIILGISIFSLVFTVGDVSEAVPFVQVSTVVLAGFALVLPSLGVHRRLQEEKRAELDRIAARLRELPRGPEGTGSEEHLAALLTLRQHVTQAREWPFGFPALARFSLYAAIGVGSWFGGALVDRVVDFLLD